MKRPTDKDKALADDPQTPQMLRSMLRAAQKEQPSAAQMQRMAAALAPIISGGSADGGASSTGQSSASSSSADPGLAQATQGKSAAANALASAAKVGGIVKLTAALKVVVALGAVGATSAGGVWVYHAVSSKHSKGSRGESFQTSHGSSAEQRHLIRVQRAADAGTEERDAERSELSNADNDRTRSEKRKK